MTFARDRPPDVRDDRGYRHSGMSSDILSDAQLSVSHFKVIDLKAL